MSNKTLLKVLVAFGLLAIGLVFLGANFVPRISATSSIEEGTSLAVKNSGSDSIEHSPATVARQARQIELARIKDEGSPADTRLARQARQIELARIKDEGFMTDSQVDRLAWLDELARIKDQGFMTDSQVDRLAWLDELARIKDQGFMTDSQVDRLDSVANAASTIVVTTDAIAGTWYGNMHFSNRSAVERVKLTIPAGCQPGSACGSLLNYPMQCTWEITYDGFSNGAYQYHYSDILMGGCSSGSAGTLSLQPDGSLYRVHTTPAFTATGILKQRPNP
jgi:hypothetical protein